MSHISTDSTKVLTEKLALARELSTLKPEVEHLRSQATQSQTLLAEKLALQRQITSLEVELETEKRASTRRAQKDEKDSEKEAKAQDQLMELRRERQSIVAEKAALQQHIASLEAELDAEKCAAKRLAQKEEKDGEKGAKVQDQINDLRKEQRTVVSENLALQRLVNTLEVELENEKHASQRAARKDDKVNEMDSKLQAQVSELKKELSQERKEKERVQRAADHTASEIQSKFGVLESKMEQLRTKLRTTKDQLKESQAELTKARTATAPFAAAESAAGPANPRKRRALDLEMDAEIGTPDGVAARGKRAGNKRGRMDQTMLGEKSMFSITPFLNRTTSVAPDSPGAHEVGGDSEDELSIHIEVDTPSETQHAPKATTASPVPKAAPQSKKRAAGKSQQQTLSEAKSDRSNAKAPAAKRPKPMMTLEQVIEEEGNDENALSAPSSPQTVKPAAKLSLKAVKLAAPAAAERVEPKKKMRKLHGGAPKTLFDEDDAEVSRRPVTASMFGGARGVGKGGLAGPKGGMKGGLNGSGVSGAFGGVFSPLKKDRRGVGASFLA